MCIFCDKNKIRDEERRKTFDEAKEFYDEKQKQEKIILADSMMRKLVDISNNISCSVEIETDDSGAIKSIIGEIEHSLANKILGEAKKEVIKFLTPN